MPLIRPAKYNVSKPQEKKNISDIFFLFTITQSGLIHSAMTGNVVVARQLVKLSGLEINLADNEGNTALHLAAQAGTLIFYLEISQTAYFDCCFRARRYRQSAHVVSQHCDRLPQQCRPHCNYLSSLNIWNLFA